VDNVAWADTVLAYIDSWTSFSEDCAGDISPPQTYVPDDNFENYLETHNGSGYVVTIGDPSSMGNGIANDDSVTTTNINNVSLLYVPNLNISDLTGIENFGALTELTCHGNQLTSLDVSNNTQLGYLYCDDNQLILLNVSNLSLLYEFTCSNNQLTSLDVSNCISLDGFSCANNMIDSLDLRTNVNLTAIECNNNELTSLDMRNGHNTIMNGFNSTENPNLTCIDVDDGAWSDSAWTGIDSWTSFSTDCSSMPVSEEPITVTEFKLHDAYPNPFNPRTSIRYDLPKASNVSISIYDLMGRKVRNLVTGQVSAGSHITQWDASNDMGSQVSAGVYIYTISADDFREVKKMILLK
jgi:hypothetical protein